jgi:hypothetical protein
MNQERKRLSDCPADRLAQCRGQAVQARCDTLQGLLKKADQRVDDLEGALGTCESWFAKHSPTAPLIGGFGDAEHPMLTYIRAHQCPPASKACSHIWVSAGNRGAGVGEICQACSEHRSAVKGSRETVDLNLKEPSFYRNRDND